MLGFQAEAAAVMVDLTVFAGNPVFHKVTGIKLNAGLGRVDFQRSPGIPFKGPGSQTGSVNIFV